MIDVEIRGPLSKKDYERVRKLLENAGADVRSEKRISLDYSNDPRVHVELQYKNGTPRIVIERGVVGAREEIVTRLEADQLDQALSLMAFFGYTKGVVVAEDVLHASYGGADFMLLDSGDESVYHYEASISATDPTLAREGKEKLEKLARNLRLPIWNDKEMYAFTRKLTETVNYMYDYDTDGAGHFKDKFGI